MESSSSIKARAIKRISRDLLEFNTSPIEGLGICIPNDSTPFELRANILILDGIYKDILLHLIMTIPENYPMKAPKMIIAPGQEFDNNFHHHVFPDFVTKGFTICTDLLDHGFFEQGQETGWTPAYTLSTILMQMQIFFSKDHDLTHVPSEEKIKNLKGQLKGFKVNIQTNNGIIVHSFENPYPKISKKEIVKDITDNNKMNEEINTEKKKEISPEEILLKKRSALEKLTCFLTKCNPEDGESILGYPMNLKRDNFGRIQIVPILEVLSYEGYMFQLMNNPDNVMDPKKFDSISLRTAMGCEYNYWFPMYTNERLYQKHRQHVLNAFSVLKFGIEGKSDYDFELSHILNIFPCLMNKMIVNIQQGVLFESVNAIEAYCHFLRFFIRLLEEFPILQKIIDRKVADVLKDSSRRNKKNLGDMGEFLILLAFSTGSFKNLEIWEVLITEYISRQFYWVIDKVEKKQDFFVKDGHKMRKSYSDFFTHLDEKQMNEFYRASKISNNLLLFNFCASEKFLSNRKVFVEKIEQNYGVIEEKEVQEFIKETNRLKEKINSYKDLLSFVGLEGFSKNQESLRYFFKEAWKNSMEQMYNKHYQ